MTHVAIGAAELDRRDAALLGEVYRFGSRNLSFISRQLGMPKRTAHMRFARLEKRVGLRVRCIPRYGSLGLVPFIIRAEGGRRVSRALGRLRRIPYITEIFSFASPRLGYLAFGALPHDYVLEFEGELIRKFRGLSIEVRYTTSPIPVMPDFSKYDFARKKWILSLDYMSPRDISDVLHLDWRVSRPLMDRIDAAMISFLQVNDRMRLSTVARKIGVSRSLLKYHYDNHVKVLLVGRFLVCFRRFSGPSASVLLSVETPRLADAVGLLASTPFLVKAWGELRRGGAFLLLEVPLTSPGSLIYSIVECLLDRVDARDHGVLVLGERILWRPIPSGLYDGKRWPPFTNYL